MWPQVLSLRGYPSFFIVSIIFVDPPMLERVCWISEFGSLGVSMLHLVTVLFGLFLVYTVAIL